MAKKKAAAPPVLPVQDPEVPAVEIVDGLKQYVIPGTERAPELSYFAARMAALGYQGETIEHEREHPMKPAVLPLFEEQKDGGIKILFPNLYGGAIQYLEDGKKERYFTRTRLHPDKADKDQKYSQPGGSGVNIFIPPTIVDKFAKGEQIKTLTIVEGEFKAYAGCRNGMDVIGVTGIHMFVDKAKGSRLHPDIIAILKTCQVMNVVLLFDADCTHVTWDYYDDPYKDLAKRLQSFYSAVRKFREFSKDLVRDVYFAHIAESMLEEAKGLDDLFASQKGSEDEVLKDYERLSTARMYFTTVNISDCSLSKLKSYFLLNMPKGVPYSFYTKFDYLIGDREFVFNKFRFQNTHDGLQIIQHADSERFVRVGCDYIKIIEVPNSKGVMEQRRIVWKIGEINRDYVNKGFKNFIDMIAKYDSFCNVPCNTDQYQQVIGECYNMYFQTKHVPEPGKWPGTEMYMKHIFGTRVLSSGAENWQLGMDYLTHLYRNPTQQLPILTLVSKEKATGKSTFLWWMRELFGENATVIGNTEINDQYNDDWASKLIIGIDEGFIDKKVVLEKIKSQSTNDKIKLRGLYQGRQDIPFFGKFILTSNDEDNFVVIDQDEVRFWVNKVPVLQESRPRLLAEMMEEIPYFLHELATREIIHPERTRHWFAKELLETEALNKVKDKSRSWIEKELRTKLQQKFFDYEYHTLYYTLGEIELLLGSSTAGQKFRADAIRSELTDRMKIRPRLMRYEFPRPKAEREGMAATMLQATESRRGRVYQFNIEDYLTFDEITDELCMSMEDIASERIKQKAAKYDEHPTPENLPF